MKIINIYILMSGAFYLFISISMYILIDCLEINEVVSYILVFLVAYPAEYIISLRSVFRQDHHWLKTVKFSIHIAFFFALSTYLFQLLIKNGLNYLIATYGVSLFMMPLRYYSNKYFVYR